MLNTLTRLRQDPTEDSDTSWLEVQLSERYIYDYTCTFVYVYDG